MFPGAGSFALQVFAISGIIAATSPATLAAPPAVKHAESSASAEAKVAGSYGKLPLSFEANQGQTDRRVRFVSRGSGYSLFLTGSGAVLALSGENGAPSRLGKWQAGANTGTLQNVQPPGKTDVVRMELAGPSHEMQIAGAEQLPGTANYFIGSDPAKWHTGVPTYAKVRYSGVYPGVDLVYYGNQGQLEYDFVVAPGASPLPIRLQFAGAKGLKLTAAGDLIVSSAHGQIAFHKPAIYQERDGQRQRVEGRFRQLAGNSIGFRLGAYDRARPLVIDPVLVYSTFLGGTIQDSAAGIAVDGDGSAYVAGFTRSPDFPVTKGSFQGENNAPYKLNPGGNAFVIKLNPAGTALVYSTFLGGSAQDSGAGIAVDGDGNAYVTGTALSADFPVTKGAFQTSNKAPWNPAIGFGGNVFVTELNASGTALVYSTYLGGTAHDVGAGIAVDGSGDAYLTGTAFSHDFPVTKGAFQTANNASESEFIGSSFVTKLNTTGTALVYSTYLGGSEGDAGTGIAIDGMGHAYVAGSARSADFPVTKGAFQRLNNSGGAAFVTEFNPAGTSLEYSTYLGGSGDDSGSGIAVGALGEAYVVGSACSTDFPTTKGAFQTVNNAAASQGCNAFVTQFNSTGTALIYSTYLGGSSQDSGSGIAVDGSGAFYVTGIAFSADFPVTKGAIQTVNKGVRKGSPNAFAAKLNPTGTVLLYSSYLGGSGTESAGFYYFGDLGSGIAIDSLGDAYVTGSANSTDFPATMAAFQPTNREAYYDGNIGGNAFVTKLDPDATTQAATAATLSASANPAFPGKAVKFTATVASSIVHAASPTGSVAFLVDGKTVETVALSAGEAIYSTSTLALGEHKVQARYTDGNSYFAPSSASVIETISSESKAAAPVIKPGTGTYTTVQSVTISDTTPHAIIYYALRDAAPTTSSTKYTEPFTISSTNTVKAIAVATGYSNSAVASAAFTINLPKAAKPTFSPVGGNYHSAQNVEIKDATAGATIYYTTNGKTPTTASQVYKKAIPVSSNETIEAIAGGENFLSSAVAIANYAITLPAATPVIKPGTGSYSAAQKVTITDATTKATIYYTTNGKTPTTASTKYAGPITVPISASLQTIEAIAVAPGYSESAVATATYTITPLVATPTFSPMPGTYSNPTPVTLSDTTENSTIYYTVNGQTPTTASTKYAGTPIQVNSTETIKSLAVSGGNDSLLAIGTYTITPGVAAPPTFTTLPAQNGAVIVSLSSTTTGNGTIYYTTNGSTPTSSSPVYLAPILIASNMKLSAIAQVSGHATSPVASRTFAPNIPSGTLVWSDEFTNTSSANAEPNPSIWTYDTGNNGWGNNELEDYCGWGSNASPCDPASPNAYVGTDGYLHIVARHPASGTYTSARLKTQGLFSFEYGRLEMRIQVPEAQGFWPAGWLLGNSIDTVSWPACGEMDVQERVNAATTPDWNGGSIHGTGFVGGNIGTRYNFPSGQTAAQWHTYGMIWSKGSVDYYIDDPAHPYATFTPASIAGFSGSVWPFDTGDSFIILNLAIGGDYPGSPDSSTPFPSETLVDYVRIYAN